MVYYDKHPTVVGNEFIKAHFSDCRHKDFTNNESALPPALTNHLVYMH